jgi:hypothetical protein
MDALEIFERMGAPFCNFITLQVQKIKGFLTELRLSEGGRW